MTSPLAAIVMAGRLGTRVRSAGPKPLHPPPRQPLLALGFDPGAQLPPDLAICATPEDRAVKEVTAWPIVFRAEALWPALECVDADSAKGEISLTRAVANVVAAGGRAAVFESPDPVAPIGVNTRADLAHAAAVLR